MTNEEIIAVVTALANYRQININWHKDVKTTADRLQDFIGKPDLVVTASEQLQYRPFKSAEEVLAAIREHGSWITDGNTYRLLKKFTVMENGKIRYSFSGLQDRIYNSLDFHFADGTPFGIKED